MERCPEPPSQVPGKEKQSFPGRFYLIREDTIAAGEPPCVEVRDIIGRKFLNRMVTQPLEGDKGKKGK
jgi:hypothetical protein